MFLYTVIKTMNWALDKGYCWLLTSVGNVVISGTHVMISSLLKPQDNPLEGCGGVVKYIVSLSISSFTIANSSVAAGVKLFWLGMK